jgi:hypothetical protein
VLVAGCKALPGVRQFTTACELRFAQLQHAERRSFRRLSGDAGMGTA